jgi:hypothetical protein
MAKLTFGQEVMQNIINQRRVESGIVNTIKKASDGEKLDATIAGADTAQAGISLFKTSGKLVPVAGALISAADALNTDWTSDKTSTLDKINAFTGLAASAAPFLISNPAGILALGTIALGLGAHR